MQACVLTSICIGPVRLCRPDSFVCTRLRAFLGQARCLFHRRRSPRRRFPVGCLADLSARRLGFGEDLAQSPRGRRPARLPAEPYTPDYVDLPAHLVAVVIGGMYNPFYFSVLEAFTSVLQGEGGQALLVHVDNACSFGDVVPKLASYRVEAVVSA